MLKNFNEHAANERTFLAWVRTAIAVMAFGFLIERFDLFLKFMALSHVQQDIIPHSRIADITGLIFILIGIGMMIVAARRYACTRKEIADPTEIIEPDSRIDITFILLLILLSAAMFLYLLFTFLTAGTVGV